MSNIKLTDTQMKELANRLDGIVSDGPLDHMKQLAPHVVDAALARVRFLLIVMNSTGMHCNVFSTRGDANAFLTKNYPPSERDAYSIAPLNITQE